MASSSTEDQDLRTTIEATVTEFLNAPARALAAKDASVFLEGLTPDCTHYLRPLAFVTANPQLKGVKSNGEQKALMETVLPRIEEFQRVTVRELVIDVEKRKASVLAEHDTRIVGAAEANTLEVAWFFDLTDDGKNISRVSEFIDSATAEKRVAGMKKHGFLKE